MVVLDDIYIDFPLKRNVANSLMMMVFIRHALPDSKCMVGGWGAGRC